MQSPVHLDCFSTHLTLPLSFFAIASGKLRAKYVSNIWDETLWHTVYASSHSGFQLTVLSWFSLGFIFLTVKENLAALDNFCKML